MQGLNKNKAIKKLAKKECSRPKIKTKKVILVLALQYSKQMHYTLTSQLYYWKAKAAVADQVSRFLGLSSLLAFHFPRSAQTQLCGVCV